MIPIRDSIRPQKRPIINYLLIAINFYIFWQQLTLSPQELETLINTYGVIPQNYSYSSNLFYSNVNKFIPLVTSIFLHGGLLHIGSNMLYLWVFGDNVEDRLGHLNYLFFYLLAGIMGNIAHIVTNSNSMIPTIGASGAIAGILGFYFLAFPRSKILTLIPIFIFITFAQINAFFFLFIWIILQLLNGIAGLGFNNDAQLVAWWAHIGGFATGLTYFLINRGKKFR